MDFFNIPSELSKANSPAYKSGLLKLYAKGGFTGRSDYKRSIENDIRVGMYEDGGKSGDPTDEELAAAQLRYNQMTPAYSKAKEAYEKELKRVSDIRSNVVSEADKINRADDQYRDAFITEDFSKYPKGYLEFINAKNPQELEEARKNLPEDVRKLLPSDGKYTVAQWNPQTNSWKKGAEPNRELYCTPYGCFAYQKAGAKDVPIVSGNVGFEAMAKSGKLPFKKIDPTQREPGDVGLMVELAPADYINNQTLVRRPHHTGIYAQADIDDAENTEKGFFFNATDGSRLMYDVSLLETNKDPKDRIDYYRYVGQTEKLKSELDKMEPERQRLDNFLSQAYKERTLPSRPITAIPNSIAPQPSQPIQLFGKGGYRVVRTSERKGKTHKVIGPGGKVKYFGDPSMGERSKSKYGKEAFYKRHAKNLKANPYFRAYARATWSEGGIVRDVEPFNLSSY